MKRVLVIEEMHLHCDACGYTDKANNMKGASAEELRAKIGTPCPKCGANMLTAEDCEAGIRSFEVMAQINKAADAAGIAPEEGSPEAIEVGSIMINPRASGTKIWPSDKERP